MWPRTLVLVLLTGCDLVIPIEEPACHTNAPGYVVLSSIGQDSRYRFTEATINWQTAEAVCQSDGAHLAVPNTLDELNAIYAGMVAGNIQNDAWVGIARDTTSPPGQFIDVTGGAVINGLWAMGQPTSDVTGVAVRLVRDSGLAVTTATEVNDYVCECDGQPVHMFDF